LKDFLKIPEKKQKKKKKRGATGAKRKTSAQFPFPDALILLNLLPPAACRPKRIRHGIRKESTRRPASVRPPRHPSESPSLRSFLSLLPLHKKFLKIFKKNA